MKGSVEIITEELGLNLNETYERGGDEFALTGEFRNPELGEY